MRCDPTSRAARLLIASAALFAGFSSTPLQAAKIVVSKNGPVSSIQDGVDQAAAGDKVIVKAGVYREAVTIPPGKDGLQLLGKGAVIIDALGPGGAGLGPALTIQSPGVTVRKLTIRHTAPDPAPTPGYGIRVSATGARIEKCAFIAVRDRGIVLENAHGTSIRKCRFLGGGDWAIEGTADDLEVIAVRTDATDEPGIGITGDRFSIRKCRIRVTNSNGIEVDGDDGVIQKCRVQHVSGDGIRAFGARLRIENNRVEDAASEAITVSGDDAMVEKNRVLAAGDAGVEVVGERATVQRNRVMDTDGGIDITGGSAVVRKNRIDRVLSGEFISVDGDAPEIVSNRARWLAEGSVGILVTGASSGTVAKNDVRFCNGSGIVIDSSASGVLVQNNDVRDCGAGSGEEGIHVQGANCIVEGNDVRRVAGDGIRVSADGVQVRKNVVRDNTIDGIDVESGDGVVLDQNEVSRNAAEGIENNGTNAVITSNTSKKNRIDFANDGSVATFQGNAIADGSGTSTAPEID